MASVANGDGDATNSCCERFVQETNVPINALLRCTRRTTAWEDAFLTLSDPPPLYVCVDRLARHHRRNETQWLRLLIQTMRRLESCSFELGSVNSSQKETFWTSVFPSYEKGDGDMDVGIEKWMLAHDTFPRIVFDFHKLEISQSRLDAIAQVVAERVNSVGLMVAKEPVCHRTVAFGLKFTQCELFNTHSMVLLRQFLEQLFMPDRSASCEDSVKIRSLDLSNNQMNKQQLSVLVQIVKKNREVYNIEEIQLCDVYFSRHHSSDEANVLQTLIRAIFDQPLIDDIQPHTITNGFIGSGFKRVSLNHTSLRAQHFAALCASLRYGCSVKELSLVATLNQVTGDDKRECWRWLAFGLFYPRLRRFKEHFKLEKIDLSRLQLNAADVETIRKTLANPAAELLPSGYKQEENVLISCLVAANSQVYDANQDVAITLKEPRILEALCVSADWISVVLPGFGLGWVQAECVVKVEREPISSFQADHLFDLCLHRVSSHEAVMTSLLRCIGRHLRAVSLKFNHIDHETIAVIRSYCVNLMHLDLEGCSIDTDGVRLLVSRSQGQFSSRLLSLNLSDNFIGDEGIDVLASALENPGINSSLPALRELRLISTYFSLFALSKLSNSLHLNRTLALLEFEDLPFDSRNVVNRVDIDTLHQAKLLQITLPLDQKLAILSVLHHDDVALLSARKALDPYVVSLIFQFTGNGLYRRLLWRSMSDGDY
uniref:Uncharacterized protein n=1 Tax=Globisporangium ultimum (strain ATCC 200006 / CBS 805.95 / DAOM BR144) TaxID=431595 RepID=K3X7S8_GLOUD